MFDMKKLERFVESKLSDSTRPNYPFRKRFFHTKRVFKWVKLLHKEIGGDIEVLEIASLLHDVGWDDVRNHADISYEIASEYLMEYDPLKREKVLEAVKYHNRRDTAGLHLESYIIMDADLLDEVGATTIIWDTLASCRDESLNYYTVLENIRKYSGTIHNQIDLLHFDKSKELFKERVSVIDNFIKELEFELSKK